MPKKAARKPAPSRVSDGDSLDLDSLDRAALSVLYAGARERWIAASEAFEAHEHELEQPEKKRSEKHVAARDELNAADAELGSIVRQLYIDAEKRLEEATEAARKEASPAATDRADDIRAELNNLYARIRPDHAAPLNLPPSLFSPPPGAFGWRGEGCSVKIRGLADVPRWLAREIRSVLASEGLKSGCGDHEADAAIHNFFVLLEAFDSKVTPPVPRAGRDISGAEALRNLRAWGLANLQGAGPEKEHGNVAPKPPASYLGDGLIRRPKCENIRLFGNEVSVLEAVLEFGPLELADLKDRSGVPNANVALAKIRKKHGLEDCIFLPGGKARGGYRASIIDSRKAPETIAQQ